jgi:hypothetical protein
MLRKPTFLGIMIFIAYIAVGMAAIRSNDSIWALVVVYLTAFVLCFAALMAIHRRGAWAGFAVFGWAYFLIFQPNSALSGPASLTLAVVTRLVIYFSNGRGRLPYYSLSSGLSLASVAVGFLGAFIGWLIERQNDANHREAVR